MKTFYDATLDAIRNFKDRADGKNNAAARALGLKDPSLLSQWLNGRRSPSLAVVGPVMDKIGVRVLEPQEEMVEYSLIPKVAAKAGAGASLVTSGEVEGMYAFRKDFLGREHISEAQSILIDVMGDSMEPLFRDGDTLLVDKSDKNILDGRIYLVTLGDELRVKRVLKSVRGLILRSENPRYSDVPVEGPDLETFIVHGRARWCGKLL